jgi:non-ribosomal peptide synthetase-like protein
VPADVLVYGPLLLLVLAFLAWRRYLWVFDNARREPLDTCPYSLTDRFGEDHLSSIPHQKGVRWLTEIFSRSAARFPDHTALQIAHTGKSLTFSELDSYAEAVAAELSPFLTGPDQVVAIAMAQDDWHIVAGHLGILKAAGAVMVIDTSLPDALMNHVIEDAKPVAVLTRGQESYRNIPTIDVQNLHPAETRTVPPPWLDDPSERLATVFYTSGTTGKPKGVECLHAGFVNLALSYADYFDLVPGMDATSLTSSLGYDGSISEMYSAWVSGCAVVMLTSDEIRSGPDLIPVLRDSEVTVLFCPPVLLSTLTQNPEIDLPYPLCRYIVPAGEAFPAALVEPWTRGRRQIINTYGPTEASTDTSRQSLRPEDPVTIGSPFPNVTYVILEVGTLTPLPHGETGELCIGGVHVARGYRNLPDQTARQFIEHPQFGRLYRTGDKCRIDPHTYRVHFLGRTDAQIKVRGHRVEIQPIEDILQTQFREIESAVVDYQNEELVAFVLAPSLDQDIVADVMPVPGEWRRRITDRLSEQLPSPSIPGRIFQVREFTLKPRSGKIDRGQLPDLSQLSFDNNHAQDTHSGFRSLQEDGPANPETEPAGSNDVLAICRDVLGADLNWDDEFVDHGGHSILIAQLVQRLQVAGWAVTVRDLLSTSNTARKIAGRPRLDLDDTAEETARPEHAHPLGKHRESAGRVMRIWQFTSLQAAFLLLLYAPAIAGLTGVVAIAEIGQFFAAARPGEFLAVGFASYLLALMVPFAALLWVMAIKILMGGHYRINGIRPGEYPKWSRMHLRIWCIRRMELTVLRPLGIMFRSTVLMSWMLRRLGAGVGRNLQCSHDAQLAGPLDLMQMGDDVTIQTGACINTSRWVGQMLHIGPIHLESGCKIGMRSGIANDVTVGRDSWITPLTPILSDVGPNEIREGAPARFSGRITDLQRTSDHCRSRAPLALMEILNISMTLVLECILLILPAVLVSWYAATIVPFGASGQSVGYFMQTPLPSILWHVGLYAFMTSWLTIVLISLLVCLFLRLTPASPGLYPSRSLRSALLLYRIKKMNQVQNLWRWTITGQYLRSLAGMRFTRFGGSECDLMYNLVPECVRADSKVFWSHGCFMNVLDYGARHHKLGAIDMPAKFFVSNNSVMESGQFPSNFLLGVSTPGNDIRFRRQMRSRHRPNIRVAGNPPLKFGTAFQEERDESENRPGFFLFLGRLSLGDFLSIGLLPVTEVLVYAIVYTTLLRFGGQPALSALLTLMITGLALVMLCILVKRVLVGSKWGSDHSTPFWSWRHFTYFFTQDCFFAWCRGPLRLLAGTLLTNPVLRRMGCRVGKRTIFNAPLQVFDWNAVSFGQDCMVDGILQYHTFEDMILQVKKTEVQSGSAINFGATLMGGARIEPDTTFMPLSLVLKGMQLPSAIYQGSPVEPDRN